MLQTAQSDRLRSRIAEARDRTLTWLDAMALPDVAPGVTRFSSTHDPVAWPGVLLPGTYNGLHCRALLGGLDATGAEDRAAAVRWLESHRRNDGVFRVPGMRDDTVFKKPDPDETWTYIDFHVTNYSLGAIEMLDADRAPRLDFLLPWLDETRFDAWFDRRDWSDPWQEGNNVVNLASFLLLMERFGTGDAPQRALSIRDRLIDRLEALQDAETGFWWERRRGDPRALLHAMAGAMHAFHLWFFLERPLPHLRDAVDYTLSLDPSDVMGACLDVDAVDLLFHAERSIGYRPADIHAWAQAKLEALLDAQRPDGGFADITEGMLRLDGWVGGYAEPQGSSNTFATWFRWIAIAMIAELLWPGWRPWRFRGMIGIGYCRTTFGAGPRA